jgi:hypothetical protein
MTENYQIKKWIESVIKSCNTWDQVTTSERLVKNFKKQMEKKGYDKMLMLPFIVDLNYKIKSKKRDLIENNTLIQN